MSKKPKEPMAISVRSGIAGIRVDGEINRMEVTQGNQTICLTENQARTLAITINQKFPPPAKRSDEK